MDCAVSRVRVPDFVDWAAMLEKVDEFLFGDWAMVCFADEKRDYNECQLCKIGHKVVRESSQFAFGGSARNLRPPTIIVGVFSSAVLA